MSIREPAYRCRLTKFKAASLSFLSWTLHSPLQPGFSLPLPNWFNERNWKMKILLENFETRTSLLQSRNITYAEHRGGNAGSGISEARVTSNKDAHLFPASRILGDAHLAQNKVCSAALKEKFCGFSRLYRAPTTTGDTFTEIGGGWKDSNLKLTKETSKLSGGKFLPSISRPRVNHLVRVENRIFSFHSLNWERQLQPYLYSAIHFREEFRERERIRYVLTTLKYSTLNLNFTKRN